MPKTRYHHGEEKANIASRPYYGPDEALGAEILTESHCGLILHPLGCLPRVIVAEPSSTLASHAA